MPIDEQRQRKAREYARLRHRLLALDLIITGAALLLVIVSGLGIWLRDLALSLSSNIWVATEFYFVAGFIAYGLLFAPLTYYSSFILPHRYGLSVQSLRAWLWDVLKGAGLGLLFGSLVIQVIYWLLRTAPGLWWLYAAAFMIAFSVLLANLAPVVIFPIFFKFKPLEDQDLVKRLLDLAARARTRVRGVYTMVLSDKTTAANAAFMGLGNTKRIVLGDTLCSNYTHDEIESVLAHELAHQVHNDIAIGILVEAFLNVVGFVVANAVLVAGARLLPLRGIGDPATMPLFALAMGAYGLITLPLGNAFSRWRETRADEYALRSTGNPEAFRSAMEKLADQNLAELDPEPWVEFLLYDHPPIGKRLEMARAYERAR